MRDQVRPVVTDLSLLVRGRERGQVDVRQRVTADFVAVAGDGEQLGPAHMVRVRADQAGVDVERPVYAARSEHWPRIVELVDNPVVERERHHRRRRCRNGRRRGGGRECGDAARDHDEPPRRSQDAPYRRA